MRIAFLIASLGSGGAEKVAASLCSAWAARGDDVALFTMEDKGTVPFYSLHPAVDLKQLGLSGQSSGFGQAVLNNWKRLQGLKAAVSHFNPDVVVSFVDQMNVLAIFALRKSYPVIVSERIHPECHEVGRVWRLLRRMAYPLSASIVVQTREVASWCLDEIGRQANVIPNPVAPPAAEEWNGSKKVVAVGRLHRQKGFDILLMAFSRIVAKHPDWTLQIYGEGGQRESLEQQISDLRLTGKVSMPGNVKDLSKIYLSAGLFVLSSRFEGFPNVLCEAMAHGVPVVSTDCPSGPSDIVTDGVDGLLVAPHSEDALYEGMDRMLTDEELRGLCQNNAAGVLKKFSQEKVMTLWDAVIQAAQSEWNRRRG